MSQKEALQLNTETIKPQVIEVVYPVQTPETLSLLDIWRQSLVAKIGELSLNPSAIYTDGKFNKDGKALARGLFQSAPPASYQDISQTLSSVLSGYDKGTDARNIANSIGKSLRAHQRIKDAKQTISSTPVTFFNTEEDRERNLERILTTTKRGKDGKFTKGNRSGVAALQSALFQGPDPLVHARETIQNAIAAQVAEPTVQSRAVETFIQSAEDINKLKEARTRKLTQTRAENRLDSFIKRSREIIVPQNARGLIDRSIAMVALGYIILLANASDMRPLRTVAAASSPLGNVPEFQTDNVPMPDIVTVEKPIETLPIEGLTPAPVETVTPIAIQPKPENGIIYASFPKPGEDDSNKIKNPVEQQQTLPWTTKAGLDLEKLHGKDEPMKLVVIENGLATTTFSTTVQFSLHTNEHPVQLEELEKNPNYFTFWGREGGDFVDGQVEAGYHTTDDGVNHANPFEGVEEQIVGPRYDTFDIDRVNQNLADILSGKKKIYLHFIIDGKDQWLQLVQAARVDSRVSEELDKAGGSLHTLLPDQQLVNKYDIYPRNCNPLVQGEDGWAPDNGPKLSVAQKEYAFRYVNMSKRMLITQWREVVSPFAQAMVTNGTVNSAQVQRDQRSNAQVYQDARNTSFKTTAFR